MSYTCKECKIEKQQNDYYKHGPVYSRTCKDCVKAAKRATYVKVKTKGFVAIPEEKQAQIIEMLKNRKNKCIHIAQMTGIPYATLCYWVRKDRVPTA